MAATITFYFKGSDRACFLDEVDQQIVKRVNEYGGFHELVDVRWCWHAWMDHVGIWLAFGRSMEEVRQKNLEAQRYDMLYVCDAIEEHFTWR